VEALCRRYRKATANLQVAEREFHALNSTVDPPLLEEWQTAEAYAMEHRATNVKVMDIYDVQIDTGESDGHSVLLVLILSLISAPGRANYQLELSQREPTHGIVRGTAAWLAKGLRIQESQSVFFPHIKPEHTSLTSLPTVDSVYRPMYETLEADLHWMNRFSSSNASTGFRTR